MDTGRDNNAGGEEAERKKMEASRRLRDTCKAGDVEAARQAIEDGADVDALEEEDEVEEEGQTALSSLMFAAHLEKRYMASTGW